MPETRTTEPVVGTIQSDDQTLSRWLEQAFEAGWDASQKYPNDPNRPKLRVEWFTTTADGRISPTMTVDLEL